MKTLVALSTSLFALTLWLAATPGQTEADYVGQGVCAACHSAIAESFEQVGMARTFQPIAEAVPIEDWEEDNRYYHEPSNQYFLMTSRDGSFFQKRYQLEDGLEVNAFEMEIDFAVGSGFKERDYATQLPGGELVQMPVVWYRDEGVWSIAPGYDHPDHDGFRRRLNYRCMFCHAAYPELGGGRGRYEAQSPLFEPGVATGIDCERCHGPGSNHVERASSDATALSVRESIVNPSRLDRDREMDVCLQCHLETTSTPLPNSTLKVGRGMFSFRPGEKLTDYAAYFDFPPGVGHDDDFNIVHQGYQLVRSACFKGSEMTCVTCHDPHRTPEDAPTFFKARCMECHDDRSCALDESARTLANGDNCMSCHMPQRRTDDIVHVVMTDHYIRRFAPENALAPIEEKDNAGYRGDLAFYLPEENAELYMGIGLVRGPDLRRGVQMLESAIRKDAPTTAEPHFYLAAAYRELGRSEGAMDHYRKAIEIDPAYAEAHYNLGLVHLENGRFASALELFEDAIRFQPARADNYVGAGVALASLGRLADAKQSYERALELDPLNTVALNNLGVQELQVGNPEGADSYFTQVLRIDPNDRAARNMLERPGG